MGELSVLVPPQGEGQRLDKVLPELAQLSRAAVQALCQEGSVLVNGRPAGKKQLLRAGEEVVFLLPEPVELEVRPEAIPLDVVYEDNWLLVVNKPKGMVVHPAPGNYTGTLVNALLHHCKGSLSGINGVIRPGIVHRIDKDTSGLLIVAKNDQAHRGLAEQIQAHSFTREYEAIIHGHFRENTITINAPIGRSPADRKKMCVTQKNATNAVTHVEVLGEYPGFSHVRCRLETGRTHQIRVHLSHLGHPVLGDVVYGPKKPAMDTKGQCLHARSIAFVHPETGERLSFTSPLPEYFTAALEQLGE